MGEGRLMVVMGEQGSVQDPHPKPIHTLDPYAGRPLWLALFGGIARVERIGHVGIGRRVVGWWGS
jgi:hypothetical protein